MGEGLDMLQISIYYWNDLSTDSGLPRVNPLRLEYPNSGAH